MNHALLNLQSCEQAWKCLPKPLNLPTHCSDISVQTSANQDSQDEIIPLFLYFCDWNCYFSRIDSSKPLEEEWPRIQNTCAQVVEISYGFDK